MSVQLVCLRCPYFHPVSQDCPPGWHDVQSAGGGDGSGGGMRPLVKVAAWAGLAAAVWVMLVGLVVLVTVAVQAVAAFAAEARDRGRRVARMIRLIVRPR